MANRIQVRRDTAFNWTAENPVLAAGEIGFELDTNRLKVGNGVNAWKVLPYLTETEVDALVTRVDKLEENYTALEERVTKLEETSTSN